MSDKDLPNKKQQSGARAIRDVLLVAVILGGGFYWYYNSTENKKNASETAAVAKNAILRDNPENYAEAEAKLKEVLENYAPSHGYSLSALAELNVILWGEQHVASRKDAAVEYTAAAMKADPGIAEQYSAQALLWTFEGKAEEAERFLVTNVLEKGGGGARIFAALGQAQRAQGKLDEARRAYKAAYDADWRNARFAQLIGESYLEQGDAANALNYFQRGLAANSDHYASQLGAARARIQRGEQIDEAKESIKRAFEDMEKLPPSLKAEAHIAQAELHLAEQKLDEAIASAVAAAEADPADAWAYAVMARAKARKGDKSAVEDFDKAIEADPFVAAFHMEAAVTIAGIGDAEKAISYLEKYPLKKDDRYYLNFGHVLRGLGRLDEALARYEEAREKNETNAEVYLSKGIVLIAQAEAASGAEKTKKFEEASEQLDIAVKAQQFNPPVYVQKAQIHFAKKEWEQGLQQYATALDQWRRQRVPRERLVQTIEEVKQLLLRNGQRAYATVWEEEATGMIR